MTCHVSMSLSFLPTPTKPLPSTPGAPTTPHYPIHIARPREVREVQASVQGCCDYTGRPAAHQRGERTSRELYDHHVTTPDDSQVTGARARMPSSAYTGQPGANQR